MRKNKRMTAAVLAVLMGIGNITVPADTVKAEEVSQEYIVVTDDAAGYEDLEREYREEITEESQEAETLRENHIAVVELTETAAEALEEEESVLFVEEDIILEASGSKSMAKRKKEKQKKLKEWEKEQKKKEAEPDTETEAEYEWNIQAVNAQEAAEQAAAGAKEEASEKQKIKVAVLDSGVDYVTGVNLEGSINYVEDAEEISPIFQDMTGHGTAIAGIITGNGETGIHGINPNAELYSVKVLDENNQAPLSRIIRGIYWCIENDIDIINMSFGTTVYSRALEQAVCDAEEAGLLLVAASGNNGGAVEYPAAFPQVMAVAASSPEAKLSEFSNRGEELEIAAPGEKVRVAGFFDGSLVTHGTSIAVPHVAGAASLLWEKDPEKSNTFIRSLLEYSTKKLEETDACGLLDTEYALEIYDTFAENYSQTQQIMPEAVPENTETAESFEEVSADEDAYAEGLWYASQHEKDAVQNNPGLDAGVINVVKKGCIYPDKNSRWEKSAVNPRWHGKWEDTNRNKINYITICEMITDKAVYNKVEDYATYALYGLDRTTYDLLQADLKWYYDNYNTILQSYGISVTKTNRKYFLFGCGIHTISDVFAHSTAEKVNGSYKRIGDSMGADIVDHKGKRHAMAEKVVKYALESLNDGSSVDAVEVQQAIYHGLGDQEPDFRIIDIKRNVEANGYSANSRVNKVNIDW